MKGIIDSTLREGAQTVGVSFSLPQKLAIVKALSQVGIEEVELGVATRFNEELPFLLAHCREIAPQTSFSVWCRCNSEDIEYACSLSPDILSLSIPVSDLHIEKKIGRGRAWVEKIVRESIRLAAKGGIKKISLGLEDATRSDQRFLQRIIHVAAESGARRVRIADTVGIATPLKFINIINKLKSYGVEIGIHAHNDFGMATANSISCLEAGADWIDATVLGLGERAGNAQLEVVAGYLAIQAGFPYRTEKLQALCSVVSRAASRSIDPHHPVVGSKIFECETGIHLHGLEKDPATYEPYNPGKVGAMRRLIYGTKIGRHSFKNRLANLSQRVAPEKIEEVFRAFKKRSSLLGRPLHDNELIALCNE